MKILVTGAAGLIGSHLVDLLLKENYFVTGVDNLSYGNLDNLEEALTNKNFLFKESKVEDLCALNTSFDFIFHLASLKKTWGGELSSSDMMNVNFKMTQAVVTKSIQDNSQLVFISTSDIYGNSTSFLEDDPITIGPPTNERYSYALSKLHSEQYILNYINLFQLKGAIIRVFGCMSKRSNPGWSGGPLGIFVNCALKNKPIPVHGNGEQTRSIAHALDVANGIKSTINNIDNIQGEIINVGTDEQISIKSLAEYVRDKVNPKGKIEYIPRQKVFGNYQEILVRFANLTKASKLLNYKVTFKSKEVFDEVINYYITKLPR